MRMGDSVDDKIIEGWRVKEFRSQGSGRSVFRSLLKSQRILPKFRLGKVTMAYMLKSSGMGKGETKGCHWLWHGRETDCRI